ncbi:MAG: hypothetical protein HUU12_07715 [Anaerolineales bacterium]|nr:hypothetical protein [Anaerolineales bacterium]NUQ59250.1 hypothetical protein [Anaerolineales bacterium]
MATFARTCPADLKYTEGRQIAESFPSATFRRASLSFGRRCVERNWMESSFVVNR